MIVDEADSLFLDNFCEIQGDGPIVGLTATSIDAMYDYEQTHMLEKLRFEFVASGISDRVQEHQVEIVATVDVFLRTPLAWPESYTAMKMK